MKRIDLIRTLEDMGCILLRHGGKHDWYQQPATGVLQPVPRHREIKEPLAKRIIKVMTPLEETDSADTSTTPE